MPQFDNNPVSGLNAFFHIWPKLVVERARTSASKGLVLDGDLVGIEEFMLIIAPAPLAVVAVAFRARSHGGIAYEKQHGMVAHAAAAGHGTGRLYLFKAVQGQVNDLVFVVHRPENVLLGITV